MEIEIIGNVLFKTKKLIKGVAIKKKWLMSFRANSLPNHLFSSLPATLEGLELVMTLEVQGFESYFRRSLFFPFGS